MVDRSLIFDVGCNDGQDSDFYLKKGFRVVAVEANPALCEGLRLAFRPGNRRGSLHPRVRGDCRTRRLGFISPNENSKHLPITLSGRPVDNLPDADREIWRAIFHEGRHRRRRPALS